MKRAALIMDMPDGCQECGFCRCDGDKCLLLNEDIPENVYLDGKRLSGCLLRELPEPIEICGNYPQPGPVPSYRMGWNACLKTITEN